MAATVVSGASPSAAFLAPRHRSRVRALEAPPTFSIVIPTYQAAATISDAVRSALAQTHRPHQVVVVDDGSTDEPERALGELAQLITLIRKPNGGNSSALNEGARVATGEFIAILDADDAYHPRRLAVLAALASERPDLDIVTTDAHFVVNGSRVGRFYDFNQFAVDDQRTAILESCFVGGWPAVRVTRLRAIGGFDETLRTALDWDCWLRLILDGSQAGLVAEPYYEYRLHSGGVTANRLLSLWGRVAVLEKAESNPCLHARERSVLSRSLRARRTQAVLAEIDHALASASHDRSGVAGDAGRPVPRARLIRLGLARAIEARARAGAVLAATAPAVARRIVPTDRPPDQRFTDHG